MRLFFFFSLLAYHLHLHSFPTRRSSDLTREPADVRFHPAIECSVLPASPPDGEVAWPLRCGADEVSGTMGDRKSTRLNSSHVAISYAVFCLKKKNRNNC